MRWHFVLTAPVEAEITVQVHLKQIHRLKIWLNFRFDQVYPDGIDIIGITALPVAIFSPETCL